jgi:hypothetical protein
VKLINPVTKHHVYLEWLKSELYLNKQKVDPDDIKLMENANLADATENYTRENLLLNEFDRAPIIDRLPTDLSWYIGELEPSDIDNLYVIPAFDWYMDAGPDFKIPECLNQLKPGRGFEISDTFKGTIDHYSKVENILKSEGKNIGKLTVISTNLSGPYTLVDGNHRALALYKQGRLAGTKIFLGVSSSVITSKWSVEQINLKERVAEFENMKKDKLIW